MAESSVTLPPEIGSDWASPFQRYEPRAAHESVKLDSLAVEQGALFYNNSIDAHVPADHLLRSIDRFVNLSELRRDLAPFYSTLGRPSIDPELMIRMLIIGYCFGIGSEWSLCEELHLNLAYRWFCRLGLDGDVPDYSIFSKNRHGRFCESDLLRRVFETVLQHCIGEGLVGGEGFAVDASLTKADANRQKGIEGENRRKPPAGPFRSIWLCSTTLLSELFEAEANRIGGPADWCNPTGVSAPSTTPRQQT